MNDLNVRLATESDIPTLLHLIKQLAEYEKLSHAVVATENELRRTLFGDRPVAEALIGEWNAKPVAFAVFFHNYSTFLARPGLYLEDLFVIPECRGMGFGRTMLAHLARIAVERKCGRFEWAVLGWNVSAINFYKKLGAVPMNDWTVFRIEGESLKRLADS